MSNADYIKGFNNGLIAGLTQKPLVFGLGVMNKRKSISMVWSVPDDNYTMEMHNILNNGNSQMPIAVNWGDGTISNYNGTTWHFAHRYTTAGSYKVVIDSDAEQITAKMDASSGTNARYLVTQLSLPALALGVNGRFEGAPIINLSLAEGLSYFCEGCFGGTNITNIIIPSSVINISNRMFASCGSLRSVTINFGTETIGESAFQYCSLLPIIEIPNTVTTIGNRAFADCYNLTNVIISDSVIYIGERAFHKGSSYSPDYYIPALSNVQYLGTTAQWQAITLGADAFPSGVVVHCSDGDITI